MKIEILPGGDLRQKEGLVFLSAGFRPFFLLAAVQAVLSMALWSVIYYFRPGLPLVVPHQVWHGHEMVYGYSMAVIAGFLLTAVRNWTRLDTASGGLLLGLALLWVVGRIPPLVPALLYVKALGDLSFGLTLMVVLVAPLRKRRMMRQWPVALLLTLFWVNNLFFYLAAMKKLPFAPAGTFVYTGLYLVLTLVFVFARRLIPNFIRTALRQKMPLANKPWVDKAFIPLFIAFSVNEVVFHRRELMLLLSLLLLGMSLIRLADWYRKGIWQRHLLWSLYLAYAFLTLGFALKVLESLGKLNPYLSLHAFTAGGLVMLTLSMMSRVSFGHSGRNVMNELKPNQYLFLGIPLVLLLRVILPALLPGQYVQWVLAAMAVWVAVFLFFIIRFFRIWTGD